MNLKKMFLVAVLAVSQSVAAVPAFAAPVSTQTTTTENVGAAVDTEVTPLQPEATDPLPPLVTEPPAGTVIPTPTPVPAVVVPTATPAPGVTETPIPAATVAPEATIAPVDGTMPTDAAMPTATPPVATPGMTTSSTGGGQLILMMNSNKMFRNGTPYTANQPMAVKNGVSYVSIRAMVEMVGVAFTYDAKTKEVIVTKGTSIMRFKTDSKIYTVDGTKVTMKGPAYQFKGTFMIPLTSITSALKIPYTVDNVQKRVILTLNTKPTASFTVQPKEIYAGETTVNYLTTSSSPNGVPIVEELWSGNKMDVYDQPGFYTITYSVRDANNLWSDPYPVTIQVLQPNQPPVAQFTTDKEEYKMGEPVTLTDTSYDPENEELTVTWNNRALAYFNPGPTSIQLTVTDKHGLSSTFEKTITITSEQLYTQDEVTKLFTIPGDIISMDGGLIPALPNLPYTLSSEGYLLIRSNSPETVNTEGVLYRESSVGNTRFLVHHMNNMATRQKLYVIATNNNLYPTTIKIQYLGIAGPVVSPEYTGKISIQKYFDSMVTGATQSEITLQPGQSIPIMTDLNKIAMKPKEVLSLSADLFSDLPVQYNVVMVEQSKDPVAELPYLPVLDRDGVHTRGTFPDSTRIMNVTDLVGATQSKLILGDNVNDKNLDGIDPMNQTTASNAGNFGVLYKIVLERVAANTLITFNPRGGGYLGSVLVNGTIVNLPNKGKLDKSDMNAVVYRTGEYEGRVELVFSVASGSNLPVNFVFTPLPAKK
ncbi:copper amine oxidase N-terminal domain-containing protein [Paenibacillus tritici]|uniref:Copper amine oxidase N-terminal domain-containing protein n=1 Tax=Paenibacillus tritici TaxID=1873425 RepID=A0ABX2DK70_9BACL|nr:stalk domain-containing protein [Paenibacillus tritici]NQX45008.1 copper amine oxidase N-terminal domain-containing protein [Paenibacillus tritici]